MYPWKSVSVIIHKDYLLLPSFLHSSFKNIYSHVQCTRHYAKVCDSSADKMAWALPAES